MELRYQLTCNPWADRGPVVLADLLEVNSGLVEQVEITAGEIVVRFHDAATQEQIAAALAEIIRSRENNLFVPNSLARVLTALGRDVARTDESGRRATDLTVPIRPDELPQLKERKLNSVKAGENKIYRLTASYPGMPADWRGIYSNADEVSEQVVEEMAGTPTNGAGSCAVSSTITKHLAPLTQSLQPFANKHHNAAVRGFGGGNGYFKASAAWRYALALSATESYHPFFEVRDEGTTILLPLVDDLSFLHRLHRHFQRTGVLNDIARFNHPTSSTNIRELYKSDDYSGLVSLLHCIRNPLTTTDLSGDMLDETEMPRLTRWITCRFKRATYVSFGTFHVIEVDHSLFDYVKPLPFQRKDKEASEYTAVTHVFSRMKWPDTGVAERFSHALVKSSSPAMKTVLWEMYKDSNRFVFYNRQGEPATLVLFNDFINHFMEVNHTHMNTEIRDAAKDMGKLTGRAFPRDLTLLSRIYNIHNAEELRDAIKTVLFRLEKLGVDQARRSNVPRDERLWPIRNKPFEVLLEGIDDRNFREIADVFSIFASLNAFNANVGGKSEVASDGSGDDSTSDDNP
ncbi:MAG TPA: hypothetical protein VF600_10700 [Abditibacteriaceae bacterium]